MIKQRHVSYMGLALALVLFGLVRLALANATAGNDLCALVTTERWAWLGPYTASYVPDTEAMNCIDNGCTSHEGTCDSTPTPYVSNPLNVGDQDGDGEDDYEDRFACPCAGIWDGDPAQYGGGYCETVAVIKSWVGTADPDRISIECIRYQCPEPCEILTWTDPETPEPPNQYHRKQTCACD